VEKQSGKQDSEDFEDMCWVQRSGYHSTTTTKGTLKYKLNTKNNPKHKKLRSCGTANTHNNN